jgi:prepilin-type N-terminal cleavage/methylation domain-containing protein
MKKMNNKGFSLIELIIVIAIMAVLVAVIAPNLTGYLSKSKKNTDVSNADTMTNIITNALQDFTTDSSMKFEKSAEADAAASAKAADDYLLKANPIDMNTFITKCANADEDSVLNEIYVSLKKYATTSTSGSGATATTSAAINPKVTGNKFVINFDGSYDEGFTCKVESVEKTTSAAGKK